MNTGEIQNLIDEFLKKMSIDIESLEEAPSELPDYVKFVVKTPDSGILIGKDGEHLSALGFVLRKAVEKAAGEEAPTKFFVDVGGYQSNKIQKIQKVATIMADRATSFKRDIELPPMSPYERMVIHSTLTNKTNIETESQGQGRERRIIVRYVETGGL